MSKINILNIVLSGHIHKRIPLDSIAFKINDVQYEPQQFSGLIIRVKTPKITTILFSTGKIGIMGYLPEMRIEKLISAINRELNKTDFKLPLKIDFKIENIVAMTELNSKIHLDKVASFLEGSEYEPEQFPGIVYRVPSPTMTFLIFSSGKIIIVGAKNLKELKKSTEKLIKTLKDGCGGK